MADGGWRNPTLFAISHQPSAICHLPSGPNDLRDFSRVLRDLQ